MKQIVLIVFGIYFFTTFIKDHFAPVNITRTTHNNQISNTGKSSLTPVPVNFIKKSTVGMASDRIKPIENIIRQTAYRCSTNLPTMYGEISNYSEKNLYLSTISEPGINPVKNLLFDIKKAPPKPFNDYWAKSNTVKGLHNAASKDGKLDYVLKISERMHLPPSVAVVPIIESNYKNRTLSSKGAAGIWQLMPQTARDYGIKVEERYQLAASTKAALHLLKDLHDKFNNWELAYAAYNAGGNRVLNAVKRNPAATSIDELDLPRETKEYVKRLKKINEVIKKFAHVKSNISQLIADFEY